MKGPVSLPPATKLGQGNIFRSVCQEFCSHPGAVHAGRYEQQAGGTHPTGMHTCWKIRMMANASTSNTRNTTYLISAVSWLISSFIFSVSFFSFLFSARNSRQYSTAKITYKVWIITVFFYTNTLRYHCQLVLRKIEKKIGEHTLHQHASFTVFSTTLPRFCDCRHKLLEVVETALLEMIKTNQKGG